MEAPLINHVCSFSIFNELALLATEIKGNFTGQYSNISVTHQFKQINLHAQLNHTHKTQLLQMRGVVGPEKPFEEICPSVDLFFYR
jgi:hypothetical protein